MRKTILSLICVFTLLSACSKIELNEPSSTPNSVNRLKSSDTILIDTIAVVTPTPYVKTPVVIPRIVVPPIVIKTPFVIPRDGTKPVVTKPVVTKPVVTTPVGTIPVVTTPVGTTPVVTTPVSSISFSKNVVPVLSMCQNCHNHNWTSSTNASTYYTNLVSDGYINVASYTSSDIYRGINNGHFSTNSLAKTNTDKIINWMKEGSKNN